MKHISDDMDRLIRRIFARRDPILAEIIINWTKIVGLKFSKNASPLRISKSYERNNKINILYVQASNSSLSMEMSFQQDIIIERLTVYLGFKAIHKLKLIVT